MINENIKEEAELVQKMILEFFKEECSTFITEEHLKLINIIFNRTEVLYDDIELNGLACHESRTIKINQIISLNIERVLSYLIHEYCHMFIDRNYKIYKGLFPELISEGMCDTFSDLVMNYYFKKHNDIFCKGRKLSIQLPYDSISKYKFYNGWVRTMLYPLEETGKDKEAIIELLLGKPIRFFELTMGSEFSENIPSDEFGFPLNDDIDMTYKQLYLHNYKAYHNINKESIYYRMNHILAAFIIQEKIEHTDEIPIYDLHDRIFNENFISDVYFTGKKLYEIPMIDLQEFIELYSQSKTPEKVFIKGYEKFVNNKIDELSDKEIKNYSFEIIKNMKELLKGLVFYDRYSFDIGKTAEQVILKCLQYEIQKLNESHDIVYIQNLYNLIYPEYVELFKKASNDDGKIILETFQSIEIFFVQELEEINKLISENAQHDLKKDIDVIKSQFGINPDEIIITGGVLSTNASESHLIGRHKTLEELELEKMFILSEIESRVDNKQISPIEASKLKNYVNLVYENITKQQDFTNSSSRRGNK